MFEEHHFYFRIVNVEHGKHVDDGAMTWLESVMGMGERWLNAGCVENFQPNMKILGTSKKCTKFNAGGDGALFNNKSCSLLLV